MAQEVESVMPEAVDRGPDGDMGVSYGMLGLPFETYAQWISTGWQSWGGIQRGSGDAASFGLRGRPALVASAPERFTTRGMKAHSKTKERDHPHKSTLPHFVP
jgi:hypothetical protein